MQLYVKGCNKNVWSLSKAKQLVCEVWGWFFAESRFLTPLGPHVLPVAEGVQWLCIQRADGKGKSLLKNGKWHCCRAHPFPLCVDILFLSKIWSSEIDRAGSVSSFSTQWSQDSTGCMIWKKKKQQWRIGPLGYRNVLCSLLTLHKSEISESCTHVFTYTSRTSSYQLVFPISWDFTVLAQD